MNKPIVLWRWKSSILAWAVYFRGIRIAEFAPDTLRDAPRHLIDGIVFYGVRKAQHDL